MRKVDAERRVVAVTGAHGYTGVELLRRLEREPRYAKLIAIDVRAPQGLYRTEFHKVDLTLPSSGAQCAEILEREKVDTFIHGAFLSGPTHNRAWAHELEVIGTVHVLGACSRAGVRKLILRSSTGVYGPHATNPNFLNEEHSPRGLGMSRFFNDKLEADKEVRRYQDENPEAVVTILRLAPVLGPQVDNYVTRFFRRPVAPVLMGFDPLLQFVHEDDAVRALELVVERDCPGTFNIVGEGVLPYSTVVARMGKLPIPVPHIVAYPLAKLLWATQVMESPPAFLDWLRFMCVADGRRANEVLGFLPRYDIRAAIDDYLGLDRGRAVLGRFG